VLPAAPVVDSGAPAVVVSPLAFGAASVPEPPVDPGSADEDVDEDVPSTLVLPAGNVPWPGEPALKPSPPSPGPQANARIAGSSSEW